MQVARLNNLGQVTVELVRGGTMHWGDAEGGAPPKVSAPALEGAPPVLLSDIIHLPSCHAMCFYVAMHWNMQTC